MKLAISAKGNDKTSELDPRFGRAAHFVVVDTDTGESTAHDNAQNLNAMQGAGIQAGQAVIGLGVDAVITGHVGPKAFQTLRAGGVRVFLAEAGTVGDALKAFQAEQLNEVSGADVPGHW